MLIALHRRMGFNADVETRIVMRHFGSKGRGGSCRVCAASTYARHAARQWMEPGPHDRSTPRCHRAFQTRAAWRGFSKCRNLRILRWRIKYELLSG